MNITEVSDHLDTARTLLIQELQISDNSTKDPNLQEVLKMLNDTRALFYSLKEKKDAASRFAKITGTNNSDQSQPGNEQNTPLTAMEEERAKRYQAHWTNVRQTIQYLPDQVVWFVDRDRITTDKIVQIIIQMGISSNPYYYKVIALMAKGNQVPLERVGASPDIVFSKLLDEYQQKSKEGKSDESKDGGKKGKSKPKYYGEREEADEEE